MSRSYRKNPIGKWSESDDYGKRKGNRKFRRKNKQKDYEDEDVYFNTKVREVENNWDWGSEGEKIYNPKYDKILRK